MDKKTTGIIATVAAVLLCGCPGLGVLCFGLLSTVTSFIPGAEIDVFGSADPGSATTMGIVALCVGVIFVAIPIVVGILTLRKKPQDSLSVEEPLPPAI